MSTWVDQYLEATKEAESPTSFLYWSALCAISAVIGKQIYLDKFLYKLYPNVYVMLIAESGGRKGFPISLSRSLAEKVGNTRVISGRSSIQAIISNLAKVYHTENGTALTDATAYLSFSEFGASFVEDPDSLTILTDLYDTHAYDKWSNTLKGSGKETLKNPCFTMLAGANEAHFNDKVDTKSVLGGFVGRTTLIREESTGKINDLTEKPEILLDKDKLAEGLREISKIKGEMHYSASGKASFKAFYHDLRSRMQSKKIDDKTGSMNRVHDTILKVAMLLSLSRGSSLLIEGEDIDSAISACMGSARAAETITGGQGKNVLGPAIKLVVQDLLAAEEYTNTRKRILRKYYHEFDVFDLDRVLETLFQAGWVEEIRENKEVFYRLTKNCIEKYKGAQE